MAAKKSTEETPVEQTVELDENTTPAEESAPTETAPEPAPVEEAAPAPVEEPAAPAEEQTVTPDYDPTPPPEEPVGWGLDNVYVTIEGDERDTIAGWGNHNVRTAVTLVDNEDGSIKFDFDDNGWGPASVIVYTNGRP